MLVSKAKALETRGRNCFSGIQLRIVPFLPDSLAQRVAANSLSRRQNPHVMTKHILVADDSSFLREQLRLMIERHPGWEVCEAVDGAEAVRKSQQLAPDAVVLDLRMPEMDGLAAGRRLRQLMPKLPMALFSLDTSSQLEKAAQANGIAAVISKTHWNQLFHWLETVLDSLPPTYHRARVPFAA